MTKPTKLRLRKSEKSAARKAKKKSAADSTTTARKRRSKTTVQYEYAQPARPKLRADSIIAKLPRLTAPETMRVWQNALRVLHSSQKREEQVEAQQVLEGVETVWLMRSRGVPDGWFKWPTTDAPSGQGTISSEAWLEEGMLKFLGYTVGLSGEPPDTRRALLSRAFEGVLPPVFPPDYLAGWAEPKTAARLHKMADSIASFARSAKRRDADRLSAAIADWEADLQYLHDTFYVGTFGFIWPRGAIS